MSNTATSHRPDSHAPAHGHDHAEHHAEPVEKTYALIAEFEDVDSIMAAAEKVRDAGFHNWDVHTPFPVHGIDHAMHIRPTILPWITLACGLTGLSAGLALVYFMNAVTPAHLWTNLQGYQYIISGKPYFSLPANIPILFETTVLFSAFGTVIGMLLLNNLPMHYNPLFKSERFRRVTNDRFFVVIEAVDPLFDEHKTEAFLKSLNPTAIEKVTD